MPPRRMIAADPPSGMDGVAAGSYSREQLARLFEQSNTSLSGNREDRKVPFVTLEPDDDGNYFAARAVVDEPGRTAADMAGEGTEDHRTVVFLDGSEVVP